MSGGRLIIRAAALLIVVGATALAHRQWVFLPLRCVHAASLGEEALNATGQRNDYLTRRTARRVRADLDGCECIDTADVRIPFTLGTASANAGDPRSAIAQYQRALLIDRRPEIYFTLGLAQLEALDRPAAIANLERACTFDPALLAEIPYEEIRREIERRLGARYGRDWVR
jgi:tetratricopeptide (TPR) repeat protein